MTDAQLLGLIAAVDLLVFFVFVTYWGRSSPSLEPSSPAEAPSSAPNSTAPDGEPQHTETPKVQCNERRRYYYRKTCKFFNNVLKSRGKVEHWLALGTWALALVALLALWDSKDALEKSQRAWLAPITMAFDPDRSPTSEKLSLRLLYQNTGREPALNWTHREKGGAKLFKDDFNDWDNIDFAENKTCDNLTPRATSPSVYPSPGGQWAESYYVDAVPDQNINAAALLAQVRSRERILWINGCFAYTTIDKPHFSAFCYYLYPDRVLSFDRWKFRECPSGHWAN
jgi:hypothetical protein